MTIAGDRDALHRLIDALRPEDIGTAQRVLQALNASSDPVLLALASAPLDDEAETEAEREAVELARAGVREARTSSHDDMKRKLRRA
jgi:Spy/CpxP family protein refolding chaperone